MAETIHEIPADWAKRAYADDAKYKAMYDASIRDPNAFWGEHGKRIDWIKPYTKVKSTSYAPTVSISLGTFSSPGSDQVSVSLSAVQTDGSTTTYLGTYTVQNGVIVSANITQTS